MSEIYHTLVPWAMGIAIVIGSIITIALWIAVGISFAYGIKFQTTTGQPVTFGDIIFATFVIVLVTFVLAIFAGIIAPLSIPIMIIMSIAGLCRLYKEVT